MAKSTKAGATTLAIINAYVRERMLGNFLSEFTVTRGKESSQLEGRTDWGVEIRCTLPTLNWWRNKRGGFGFMCGALHISYSLVSDPTDAGEWEARFEKELGICFNIGVIPDGKTREKVKSFIRSHDQQLRQRIVEGLGKRKKNTDQDSLYATPDNGYDLAIEEAITFITNLK